MHRSEDEIQGWACNACNATRCNARPRIFFLQQSMMERLSETCTGGEIKCRNKCNMFANNYVDAMQMHDKEVDWWSLVGERLSKKQCNAIQQSNAIVCYTLRQLAMQCNSTGQAIVCICTPAAQTWERSYTCDFSPCQIGRMDWGATE